MTTLTVPPSFNGCNGAHEDGLDRRSPSQRQIEEWLRVFIGSPQVVHLFAIGVRRPGLDLAIQVGGYFDADHLDQMAAAAFDLSGQCRGVYFTINPLIPDLLARCWNRVCNLSHGMGASDADVSRRRWLMVDLDTRSPSGVSATDAEKGGAMSRAIEVRRHLESRGFPAPILTDSGNGYHLYYRIDLPPNDELPHRVLTALNARFPNDRARIDTSVADPSRLTRVYGTENCKGDSLPDRPHRFAQILEVPSDIRVVDAAVLAGVVLPPAAMPDVTRQCTTRPQADQRTLNRARRYLATLEPAISGNHGHNRTFEAACRLVLGFDLPPEQALPLMREYNVRCVPPWSESDLLHKLHQADQQLEPRGRGYLLASSTAQSPITIPAAFERERLPGPPFPTNIPEFIPAPPGWSLESLSPESINRPPGRPAANFAVTTYWLILQAIRDQRKLPVVIPDIVFGSCVRGATMASRWREGFRPSGRKRRTAEQARRASNRNRVEQNCLADRLDGARSLGRSESEPDFLSLVERLEERNDLADVLLRQSGPIAGCPSECPLHGSSQAHEHFWFTPSANFFGPSLWQFAEQLPDGTTFDFDRRDGEGKGLLRQAIHSQGLYWTYLPAELFGDAAGLSVRQVRLIQGLMRERTRIAGNGRRSRSGIDRAEYFTGGMVPGTRGQQQVRCPALDETQRYVCFGSNLLSHRGRGYRLIGDLNGDPNRLGGWLRRLGYPASEAMSGAQLWSWVSYVLSDVLEISDNLSLTAVGLGQDGQWRTAEEMAFMARSMAGQRWLDRCKFRVYAPFDFLTRWRYWFASRLGFSFIPGGDWSVDQASADDNANPRAERLTPDSIKFWLNSTGLTQKALAERIGWTEARISRQLSGRHRLSGLLTTRIHELMGQH